MFLSTSNLFGYIDKFVFDSPVRVALFGRKILQLYLQPRGLCSRNKSVISY